MSGLNDLLGKDAEKKIQAWLDRPDLGYCFDRIPDQMTGLYGSKNICDFACFKSPYFFYIESKATWEDTFKFSMLYNNTKVADYRTGDTQFKKLLEKSQIQNVFSIVIVCFASYKRSFIFDIRELDKLIQQGTKSLNINKLSKWDFPYVEIPTIPSRKTLLDYSGDLIQLTKIFGETYEEMH